MSTITVKTIGTSSRDYSTVQAWEDAAPANLTTSIAGGEIWQGQCYNDSEFTSASSLLTISGSTTDATGYKHLTTASGQSFADNANKLTNALKYNASNGVGLRTTADYTIVVTISENYVVLEKLQIRGHYQRAINVSSGNFKIKQCIVEGDNASSTVLRVNTFAAPGNSLIVNSLFVHHTSGGAANGIDWSYPASGDTISSCTVVKTGTSANGNGIKTSSSNLIVKNCAVFGWGTTPFSGTFNASSDYNATDHTAATGGTHDLTSLTYSSQFQNTTDASLDYRAVDTGSLDTAGVRDATNTSDLDIVGQSRSTTTPTIGGWEVAAAGGGGTTVTPGVLSLTTTKYAPTVTATDNKTVVPSTKALTLTQFAPSIVHGTVIVPGVGSLTLTPFAPTLVHGTVVTPGVASLTTTKFAPTVTASDHKIVIPGVVALTTTGYAPQVSAGQGLTVIPGVKALSLSTFSPTVSATQNTLVTPDVANLILSAFNPTVTATANQRVVPGLATLTLTSYAPNVSNTLTAAPILYIDLLTGKVYYLKALT